MTLCSKRRIPVLRGTFHLDRLSAVALTCTRDQVHRKEVAAATEEIYAPAILPIVKTAR
jgi:hypothetical protein